jgi:hypothetical protein
VKYSVVEAHHREGLEEQVNAAIENGWEPQGSPFVVPYSEGHGNVFTVPEVWVERGDFVKVMLCQAMVQR